MHGVLLTGGIIVIGAFVASYQLGTELLSFGTFIGFMGIHAAAFMRRFFREEKRVWLDCLLPALGFVICFAIWVNLRPAVLIAGGVWMLAGLLYGAYKTNGFRQNIEFSEVPLD